MNIDILGISELNGLEWVNLTQMTIGSTTVGRNPFVCTLLNFLSWESVFEGEGVGPRAATSESLL